MVVHAGILTLGVIISEDCHESRASIHKLSWGENDISQQEMRVELRWCAGTPTAYSCFHGSNAPRVEIRFGLGPQAREVPCLPLALTGAASLGRDVGLLHGDAIFPGRRSQ